MTVIEWKRSGSSSVANRDILDGRLTFRTANADPYLLSPAFLALAQNPGGLTSYEVPLKLTAAMERPNHAPPLQSRATRRS